MITKCSRFNFELKAKQRMGKSGCLVFTVEISLERMGPNWSGPFRGVDLGKAEKSKMDNLINHSLNLTYMRFPQNPKLNTRNSPEVFIGNKNASFTL